MARDSVFISYSHRDREWLDRLNVHLRPLVRDGGILTWDDTRLGSGSVWETEIEAALASAKVAILLVSADFLASDFISRRELPALLNAAQEDGAVILPLILSPSRFARTPSLARFQSVNDPARPLIGATRAEQEEVLVRVTEAVEQAMSSPVPVTPRPETPTHQDVPLVERFPFSECLARLGAKPDLVTREEAFLREWLHGRIPEVRWSRESKRVDEFLKGIGEPETTAIPVAGFFEDLLACCAPAHRRIGGTYLSAKKVSEAWKLLQREINPASLPESLPDKLLTIHEFLLKTDRLVFLPERVLLGRDLPEGDDQICYFRGFFTLDIDLIELGKVPGAKELVAEKSRSLYSVVSAVFQSPDPFIYPLLSFSGSFGGEPVSMVLSRKYIEFGSMTASSLAHALSRQELEVSGIGVLLHTAAGREVQPLACSFERE
jgi:hypothetical protein